MQVRKIQHNWLFKKFWRKNRSFSCASHNFFFERKLVSLSLKKIILFQVQRFFSWIFLGANVMRNFDGKIHTACFVIILISISTFFCFLSGDQICFLHYSFFLICVRPGVWATKKITTHFFLLHILIKSLEHRKILLNLFSS